MSRGSILSLQGGVAESGERAFAFMSWLQGSQENLAEQCEEHDSGLDGSSLPDAAGLFQCS